MKKNLSKLAALISVMVVMVTGLTACGETKECDICGERAKCVTMEIEVLDREVSVCVDCLMELKDTLGISFPGEE